MKTIEDVFEWALRKNPQAKAIYISAVDPRSFAGSEMLFLKLPIPEENADLDQAFNRLWAAYPARKGPNPSAAAKKAFITACRKANPEDIVRGAERYAAEARGLGLVGTPFVTQLLTWLRQRRWLDYQDDTATEKPALTPRGLHVMEKLRNAGVPKYIIDDCDPEQLSDDDIQNLINDDVRPLILDDNVRKMAAAAAGVKK